MRHKWIIGAAALLLIAAGSIAARFEREYVMPAGSLVGLKAQQRDSNSVVVSGSLFASGAKIVTTTITDYGPTILVRVYAAAIQANDRPEDCRGSFAVAVPLERAVKEIAVGESPRWLTLGRVGNVRLRVPRFAKDSTRVVWTAERAPGR